jgi:hypothetical protein
LPVDAEDRLTQMATPSEQQKKHNLRLALVLASVALVFALGFVAKILLFGR